MRIEVEIGNPVAYKMQITSTGPLNALISTKSPITTFSVVYLDGRVDWMVAQRRALLAWTGNTLSIKPTLNTGMVSLTDVDPLKDRALMAEELGPLGKLLHHWSRAGSSCWSWSNISGHSENRRRLRGSS